MAEQERPVVWHRSPDGRQYRRCSCTGVENEIPVEHIPHTRERVPNTTVEVCYFVNEVEHTVTVMCIRTMDPEDRTPPR